jgi:hypothetical protein
MIKFRRNFFTNPQYVTHFAEVAKKSHDDNKEDCVICFTTMNVNIRTLDCGHKFHENCLNAWLNLHRTCPNCRARVSR